MSDTALPVIFHYGTNTQRLAFTPSPAAGVNQLYIWYETDTNNAYVYTTGWHQISSSSIGTVTNTGTLTSGKTIIGNGSADVTVSSLTATIVKSTSGTLAAATAGTDYVVPWSDICQGRLTTESGVPLSTADRTAQGTIYFTPAIGANAITNGQIALYNGSAVVVVPFTQLSLGLTVTSGKNYDVFVDYNSGTPQLVLSAAWTTDTARADALGVQSGLIIKSGTAAYRWVGTIRASGSNVTADSGGGSTTQVGGQRFVWNAYQQLPRWLRVIDTTNTWSYTVNTTRVADNATAPSNCVEYVVGAAATMLSASLVASVKLANSNNNDARAGIGIDSSTTYSGLVGEAYNALSSGVHMTISSSYDGTPGLGYHYVAWLETGGDGTCIFVGDDGSTGVQSGLRAVLLG